MLYLLQTGKKNLVHILLIAMIAAFMNQFACTIQNRQVASVGFYMIYILLAALTVAAFDVVIQWVESGIRNITAFMGVFYPVYFLAVAVAKGKCDRSVIYNLVLFLIYAVEIIIGNVLLPMVRVYMIIRVLNFLGPEDMLGKLSEFLELIIRWTLKTTLACVIGANLIQGTDQSRDRYGEEKYCAERGRGNSGSRKSSGRNDRSSAWNGSAGKEWNWNGRSSNLHCPVCDTAGSDCGNGSAL